MAINPIKPPFDTFKDIDGRPMDRGFVYIGEPGQSAEFSQKDAYWDDGFTDLATQPIETAGGFALNGAAAGSLYVDGDYSITVKDRKSQVVHSSLNESGYVPQITTDERNDGDETDLRAFSPEDVKTMANIHGGGGGSLPQVTTAERTAGTETSLRSFAPEDVSVMAGVHGGEDNPSHVTPAERTSGTETALRSFAPEDVAVMAVVHGGEDNPSQVTPTERTAGTETGLRSYSPEDVAAMAAIHGGGGVPVSVGLKNFTNRGDAVTWIGTAVAGVDYTDGFIVTWPEGSVVAKIGATVITDMGDFQPPLGPWTPQTFGDIDGVADSTTIQAMWNATTSGQGIHFPGDVVYGIDATIDASMADREVSARGARFKVLVDSYAFDFNPDANPASVEAGQKSYGVWNGGTFTSTLASPTATAAFRIYACRQMKVENCVFGDSTGKMIYGIMLSAMGGHEFENCRFLYTTVGVYSPLWAVDGPGQPVSTSLFTNCNWILGDSSTQQCVVNECGANRWTFQNGFCNGTQGTSFYFANGGSESVRELKWVNFGFEQAVEGGKFVHFANVDGTHPGINQVSFDSCEFGGNPSAAGTHIHVDCERVNRISFYNVSTNATQTNGNWSFQFDADCYAVTADAACRFVQPNLVTGEMINLLSGFDRRELNFPDKYFTPTFYTSVDGTSYSSGSTTIDTSTLLSGHIVENGVPPIGYTFSVRCRDSGSSGTADRRVVLGSSSQGEATRPMVTLSGVPDDSWKVNTVYVPASPDGNIDQDVYASGVGTFEMTLRLVAIHN